MHGVGRVNITKKKPKLFMSPKSDKQWVHGFVEKWQELHYFRANFFNFAVVVVKVKDIFFLNVTKFPQHRCVRDTIFTVTRSSTLLWLIVGRGEYLQRRINEIFVNK